MDSYDGGATLTVIDFEGAVARKCKGIKAPGMGGIEAWLDRLAEQRAGV